MSFSLRVNQNQQNVDAMMKALVTEVNSQMKSAASAVEGSIKQVVGDAILSSYEVRSLLGGSLQGHLGIRPGDNDNAVFQITQAIMNAIYITWTPMKNTMPGKLDVLVQPDNFANLLSLRAGEVQAVHRVDGPYTMEWLDWLLRLGDTPIVKGYEYQMDVTGRSGQGIMKKRSGATWRVPPEFAGTLEDNFVTRALDEDSVEKQISKILKQTTQ